MFEEIQKLKKLIEEKKGDEEEIDINSYVGEENEQPN